MTFRNYLILFECLVRSTLIPSIPPMKSMHDSKTTDEQKEWTPREWTRRQEDLKQDEETTLPATWVLRGRE